MSWRPNRKQPPTVLGASVAVLCVAGLVIPRLAAAQGCCSAGGGAGQSEALHVRLAPWEMVVGFSLEAARSGSAFQGDQAIDDPLNRQAQATFFSSSLGLGLPRGFAVHLVVPINDYERKYDVRIGSGSKILTFGASGMGDPIVAATRRFPSTPSNRPWSVQIGTGVQVPIGEDERREDGVRLPVDVQPAAGSWNGIAFGSVTWARGSWNAYQNTIWTLRGTNTIGYRFGSTVNASLGLGYLLLPRLEPNVQLALAHSEHDVWRDRTLSSTGSTQWLVGIGTIIPFRPQHLSFSVVYRFPIHQRYSGDQLGSSHSTTVSLLYWP